MSQHIYPRKLIAFAVGILFVPASGFVAPQLGGTFLIHSPLQESCRCRPLPKIHAKPRDEEPGDTDAQGDSPTEDVPKNSVTNSNSDPSPVTKGIRFIGNVVFDFWSFTVTLLGVVFSLGLALNLCGYGYQFSREEGVRIDTIENLRTERQFEQVSAQYGRDYTRGKDAPTQNSIDSNSK
jgi:hypothetical protein